MEMLMVRSLLFLAAFQQRSLSAMVAKKNRGWWSRLVREGGAIDLNKFKVIGYDFAPNQGGHDCPETITTTDQAARLKALLDDQGIETVAAIIGSSYGGMCALCLLYTSPSPRD